MDADQTRQQNPTQQAPQPPFPAQQQRPTGRESAMEPRPDYGAESYRGRGRLQGKVALITGADSGIGRAVALAFAREGADLLIAYLEQHEDAHETAQVVQETGRRAVSVAGDIGDEQHCRQLVERAQREFGHLDILVNNAAVQMPHESIEEVSAEEW